MILNITWSGISVDAELGFDGEATDRDIKRVAVEMIRSGDVPGLHVRTLPDGRVRSLRGRPLRHARGRKAAVPAAEGSVRSLT